MIQATYAYKRFRLVVTGDKAILLRDCGMTYHHTAPMYEVLLFANRKYSTPFMLKDWEKLTERTINV